MGPNLARKINIIAIILWIVLFFNLVPIKLITTYPLILVGFSYTILILVINIKLIGNYGNQSSSDFKNNNSLELVQFINNKAVQVSTTTFALALASKEIFKLNFYKDLLLFMIYTLIFGVGLIMPIYFISNHKTGVKVSKYNEFLSRLRSVSLSYSVGFMICSFMLVLNRIYSQN